MLSVQLHVTIPGVDASTVYSLLAQRAPGSDHGGELSDGQGPCSVMVAADSTHARSDDYLRGTLQWPTRHGTQCASEDSAISLLDGTWSCVDDGPGAALTFVARLDVTSSAASGYPEALAAQAFLDGAVVAMSSVFDEEIRVDDAVIQARHQPLTSRRVLVR